MCIRDRYKAQREETPEAIRLSVPIIKDIIRAYRIPILEVAGYEADDVIGTLATEAGRQGITCLLYTSRYQRAIEENTPLPDLIITDGGKGQMEVVREVIEDELNLTIPIAGLAKDNRHRTSELLLDFLRRLSVSNSKARYSVC